MYKCTLNIAQSHVYWSGRQNTNEFFYNAHVHNTVSLFKCLHNFALTYIDSIVFQDVVAHNQAIAHGENDWSPFKIYSICVHFFWYCIISVKSTHPVTTKKNTLLSLKERRDGLVSPRSSGHIDSCLCTIQVTEKQHQSIKYSAAKPVSRCSAGALDIVETSIRSGLVGRTSTSIAS